MIKITLISLNVLLSCFLVYNVVSKVRHTASSSAKITVKARNNKKAVTPEKTVPKHTEEPAAAVKDPGAEIVKLNIFNQERCPNAGVIGGNAQVSMTLVGTFVMGKASGAVILQKAQNRPMFPMFGGGMPGMPPDGAMFAQRQRRQGGFQMNGGSNRNQGPGGREAGDNRPMMGGGRRPGMMQFSGYNVTSNSGTKTSYKQYVRVGETMANGYQLIEVTRTKAVLMRGSEKLELELAEASANQAQRSSSANKPQNAQTQMLNTLQNMQNMQRMQMMQNMNMMRMMQNNNVGGGAPGGFGGGRGGRGR